MVTWTQIIQTVLALGAVALVVFLIHRASWRR